MNHIVPLSPENHAGKCWKRFTSYAFAAKTQLAPLSGAELPRAVHAMPLCFARKDTRFFLAGLLSPKPSENWFAGPDGRWLGGYVPACFRSHPFSLADNDGRAVLCLDESCGLISDTEGEPLFNPEGQFSNAVAQVLQFLQALAQNRAATQQGVDALAAADVMAEWPLKIIIGGESIQVAGIYRIDEARLAGLSDTVFLGLKNTQALPIAFAQLFSMGNAAILQKLAEIRAAMVKQTAAPEPDVESMLKNDDMFRF